MRRFTLDQFGRIDVTEDGHFVLFEAHAAEVHRLNNELTKLTLELAALKREKPEVQR